MAKVMAFARQSQLDPRPGLRDEQNLSQPDWDQARQNQSPLLIPVMSTVSDTESELVTVGRPLPMEKKVRHLQVTRVIHEAQKQQTVFVPHRDRIQAVMIQAQQAGVTLNYRQIAQAAGVSYSTVKKYAPGMRVEPQG